MMIIKKLSKAILILLLFPAVISANPAYRETIAGLKKIYLKESAAHGHYMVFSEKAKSEGYENISRLFAAIAYSEAIHARNMKSILSDLGENVSGPTKQQTQVSDTKDNLGSALERELLDIDNTYPEILEKIAPEGHDKAISAVRHALESEKQHRTIIESIRSSTRSETMFGIVSGIMENTDSKSFICTSCGSTLLEAPLDRCPVCSGPASSYRPGP